MIKSNPHHLNIIVVLIGSLLLTHCNKKNPIDNGPSVSTAQLVEDFNTLWENFDREYPYFIYKNIDWDAAYDQYRPQVEKQSNYSDLVDLCVEMLKPLKDGHIYFNKSDGTSEQTYQRVYQHNYNSNILDNYIQAQNFQWVVNNIWGYCYFDSIPYILIAQWDADKLDISEFDAVFEQFKSSPSMIIDVRMNPGGNSGLAEDVAGRFADQIHVYQYLQYRIGPGYDDLSGVLSEYVIPRDPWLFHRPVVVLAGPTCASSTEHFVCAMLELPNVAVIGDTTAGCEGNPVFFEFSDGTAYTVPTCIYYRTDMTVIEWNGVPPDILINATPQDFQEGRDPVLEYAIQWATQNAAPVTPESTPPVVRETIRPRIVSTTPENGAQNVSPSLSEIIVVFNEIMERGYSWCYDPRQPNKYPETTGDSFFRNDSTVVLPVQLDANNEYILWLNHGTILNFKDLSGNPLNPYRLAFKMAAQ